MNFSRCSDCGAKLYIVSENINGDKVKNCTRCNSVVIEYSTTNITQQRLSDIKTSDNRKRCTIVDCGGIDGTSKMV